MDRQQTPVWMYHFTKPAYGWMGAAHAAEIGFVFGTLKAPNPDDKALSDAFIDYWVQFSKTGAPNIEGRPKWDACNSVDDEHLVMDEAITVGSGLRCDACDLLDKILIEHRSTPVAATNE